MVCAICQQGPPAAKDGKLGVNLINNVRAFQAHAFTYIHTQPSRHTILLTQTMTPGHVQLC